MNEILLQSGPGLEYEESLKALRGEMHILRQELEKADKEKLTNNFPKFTD